MVSVSLCMIVKNEEDVLGRCLESAAGLVDERRIMCETALSVFRAGANMLITYYAKELADAIRAGEIG